MWQARDAAVTHEDFDQRRAGRRSGREHTHAVPLPAETLPIAERLEGWPLSRPDSGIGWLLGQMPVDGA